MRFKYTKLFSALSLFVVAVFGFWWFNPAHISENFGGGLRAIDVLLFGLVSYIIWHPLMMEILTWCISSHMKDIRIQKPVTGSKVAFITTIVPKNEPLGLLDKCLPSMVKAKYEHDTWLLDESNSQEVKQICKKYGVYHFSRFGIGHFNTLKGKYTKTKGGNHNSWYDTFGGYYDFVAQIDTDFVPKSNFLTKTLGYFRDPKVAFVGTPQIYGNTHSSMVARGAAEQQLNFYGAVLRGLSGMGMNLLIGANHIIRVKAFKEVDHYTAHITEDLVTGMKLHANGWKSVYVPNPLAIGEGPTTWEAYFNQQVRWAYGCIDILMRFSFQHFRKMGWRRAIYYFFLQQHYFSGLAMALSVLLLSLYFLFGVRAADVDVFRFFIFYSFVLTVCWLMSVWMQRFDVHRKKEGQLLLAGKIINIAAWPVWFFASVSLLTGKRLQYKVTPKGEDSSIPKLSIKAFIPHLLFALISFLGLIAAVITGHTSPAMLFWALSCITVMLVLPFVDILYKYGYETAHKILNTVRKIIVTTDNNYLAISEKGNTMIPSVRSYSIGEITMDCIFLSIVIVTSFAGYINRLGFYSDDWSFLGNFVLSADQSIWGLVQTATTPNTLMRPMQNIYDAVLYYIFGLAPLGYHIVNSLVFVLIIIFFYLIMRKLQLPRIVALSGALVYGLLPNYATDRFWYAAYQVNLSMLLFLMSTFSGLKALCAATKKTLVWKLVSIICLILSALSYEVVLPLLFLSVILFWGPLEKISRKVTKRHPHYHHGVFIVVNLIVFLYLIIFKAKTTIRLGSFNYPGDIVHLLTEIFRVNFIEFGLKLPLIWKDILFTYTDFGTIILSITIFIICYVYLFLTFSNSKERLPSKFFLSGLIFSGITIFILGYAIFLTNNRVGFSPTGIDNRVALVASTGIALVIVGVAGLVSKLFKGFLSKWIFSLLISILCMGSFATVNTLALFWGSAYKESQIVMADIHGRFPKLPSNSTFILDGVCPYVGPSVVFESQWDLKGALQTIYHDPTIQADIVTPRLKAAQQGLETQIYTFKVNYPYENILIYNYKNKHIYEISDIYSAERYFEENNPDYDNDCPSASAGAGIKVF